MDTQRGHVARNREGGLKDGVTVAARGVVERFEPLDDGFAVAICEVPYAAALAQLALGNVRQPLRQGVEPADQLPNLIGEAGMSILADACATSNLLRVTVDR